MKRISLCAYFHPDLLSFLLRLHQLSTQRPTLWVQQNIVIYDGGRNKRLGAVVKWTHTNTLRWLRLTTEPSKGKKWPTFISSISLPQEDLPFGLLSGHVRKEGTFFLNCAQFQCSSLAFRLILHMQRESWCHSISVIPSQHLLYCPLLQSNYLITHL